MKTTKKTPSKPAHKRAIKDLDVKSVKGRTVRGGIVKLVDADSPKLHDTPVKGG